MQENRTVHGEFTTLGDYGNFLPLRGSVTVDSEDEIVYFDVGGIGAEDIEDGIEIEFKGDDGNEYYQ